MVFIYKIYNFKTIIQTNFFVKKVLKLQIVIDAYNKLLHYSY